MSDRVSPFAYVRRIFVPYVVLPRDEAVTALRINVSDLQRRLNRTGDYVRRLQAKNGKIKQQQLLDREYTDLVKAAAWDVLNAEDDSMAERHRVVLRWRLQGYGGDVSKPRKHVVAHQGSYENPVCHDGFECDPGCDACSFVRENKVLRGYLRDAIANLDPGVCADYELWRRATR